jgi:hypothetical protein
MITKNLKYLELAAKDFPIEDSGRRALELIKLGNPFDLFFFEKLSDPGWLPVMKALGFFNDLPTGEVRDDGTATYPRSIALRGLLNLSKVVPKEVIEILEELTIPSNPAIKDQLMGILAEVDDPAISDRVLKVACRIIRTQPYANLVWIEKVLAKAMRHQCFDNLLEVVNALLDVTLAATELQPRSVDAWQIGEIDRNIIGSISETQPLPTARIVYSAFLKWVEIERVRESASSNRFLEAVYVSTPTLNEEDTPSSYWLEDFHGSVIGSHDLEAIFAYRLFTIGSQMLRTDSLADFEEFDKLLRSNPWNLFTRLRWQLYADFPKATILHARTDALSHIPNVGRYFRSHGYEMAQMLEKHSEMHRDSFLKPDEVQTFCATVQTGPIDDEDQVVTESPYRETFLRKQLYPIRSLLKGADLEFFNSLFEGPPEIRQEAFKPFSSGGARMIENVPPKKALEMPTMSDAELWEFLNNWIPNPKCPDPDKWWIEEDVNALGVMFAELLESRPDRFPASSEWWKNLTRPSVLFKPLDRAAARISEAANSGSESKAAPVENDWRNWFGLASWITNQRTASHPIKDAVDAHDELEDRTWDWPCMVVVKFLTGALGSKLELPSDLVSEIGPCLRKLIETPDSRLNNQYKPSMGDWQSTAINSVRGTAFEGLLKLALFHKRNGGNPDPEDWIFDYIVSRLKLADESPAVFAICGSNLRLLLYLFGDQFKYQPELLLPADRANHLNTLLLSHVLYDNPMSEILDVIPSFPSVALELLSDMNSQQDADRETRGDYGGRLGVHLSFYYWNQSFGDQATADSIMDRYFKTARAGQRAKVIREIANIFEKKSDDPKMSELYGLVRRLWDRRFAQISSLIDSHKIEQSQVESELAAFINWLDCECFPIEWRSVNVQNAIRLLTKTPHLGNTIKTLERFSSDPARLHLAMEILDALLSKELKEAIWSFREDRIRMILQKAFSSESPGTVKLAEGVQETLLRRGLFEYLDLTSDEE